MLVTGTSHCLKHCAHILSDCFCVCGYCQFKLMSLLNVAIHCFSRVVTWQVVMTQPTYNHILIFFIQTAKLHWWCHLFYFLHPGLKHGAWRKRGWCPGKWPFIEGTCVHSYESFCHLLHFYSYQWIVRFLWWNDVLRKKELKKVEKKF